MPNIYSGHLGFALMPDNVTQDKAAGLVRLIPSGSPDFKPSAHINLYHADLHKIPEEAVIKTINGIRSVLGKKLELGEIIKKGETELTWQIANNEAIRLAHLYAIQAVGYFNPGSVNDRLKSETFTKEEEENMRRFGFPQIDKQFRPAITLARNKTGIRRSITLYPHTAYIQQAVFAELTADGDLREIIYPA
ncbi:hypothetical protein KBB06_04305 [Candidatus Gracilibacteria bacterium]|nr:hypothetical protein [Candidatus Gracilibacteria bacterium]